MEEKNPKELRQTINQLEERISLLERVVGRISQGQTKSSAPAPAMQPAPHESKDETVSTTSAVQENPVEKPKKSREVEVGQKWFTIVGVVLIFLAALFFVQFVFQFVGPAGKVVLSYAGAALLFGVSMFTKKKHALFGNVVGAGAWGITYLVTYAMHFFPATRVILSTPLEMVLLLAVVGALLIAAINEKSKWLIGFGLLLGLLTMVLSPLSLFSIIGTVLMLAIATTIAVKMSWGDLILPAVIGAYVSYFAWFSDVGGRLPTQGGGLLEKEILSLIVLVVMMLVVAAGVILRRDEESKFNKHGDAITLIVTSIATAFLGLIAFENITTILTTPRIARGIWFLLLAGLTGGWAVLLYEYKERKDATAAGGVVSILLIMGAIAFFLPESSASTVIAWSALGLAITLAGMFLKKPVLAAKASIPLIGSFIRFLIIDAPKEDTYFVPGFTLTFFTGLIVSIVLAGCGALMRTLDLSIIKDRAAKRLPGILLAAGVAIFFLIVSNEFSGAVPSVMFGVVGIAVIAGGFFTRWKDARLIGLIALGVTVVRVFFHDLGDLEALPRVISFAILGGLLLLVGYAYNQNKGKLEKYLEE